MTSAPDERPGGHVGLVVRLLVAQAVTTLLIGLPFSRRQLSTILFTLALAAVVAGLALLARTGARTAWGVVLGFETVFFCYALSQFVFARYIGGTLFALITIGLLASPEVARAYGIRWRRAGARAPSTIADAPPESFGEESLGGHPVG